MKWYGGLKTQLTSGQAELLEALLVKEETNTLYHERIGKSIIDEIHRATKNRE